MIIYRYDPVKDQTIITNTEQPGASDVYSGKLEYKFVHEKYDTLVFEILKDPEPLPKLFADEQEDKQDILDT